MKKIELARSSMRPWSRFSYFQTIRDRLLAAFGLLVLVPVIVISTHSGYVGWRNGQAQVTRQLESVATLKEAAIERWLTNLQLSLSAVLASQEASTLLQILQSSQVDDAVLESDWSHIIEHTELFDELFLLDVEGQVQLSSGATAVGAIHRNQRYFQQGLHGNYIHPPFYSPTLGRMSMIVALPVLDEQGQTLGVLAGRASIVTLNGIMSERAGLGETGETYLVGSNHALLTNSLFVAANVQTAESTIFIRSQGANQAIETAQNGTDLYLNHQQEPVIGVYHWLPTLQVALLAEQTQTEAFASLRSALIQEATLAIIAFIIAIIAAFYTTRNLTQPLSNLTYTAEQIAQGNYHLTAPIERRDEIGTLATAFNHMTAYLNQLITNLEQHVNKLEKAQYSLQESEDRYRSLYNNSPVMMYSVNPEGELINVNRHWLQIMGYSWEEVIGHRTVDFLTPTSRQYALQEVLPSFRQTGYAQNIPYQFVTKSGHIIDVLLTATAHYNAQNQHDYSLAVIQDVTEQKQAETALRRSEARHRALLEAMPDMMFRLSSEGIILDFKADQESELTMPADEIVGTELWDTPMPAPIVQDILRLMRQAIATNQIATYEYDLQVPLGLQTFEMRMIKSGADEVINFVRNITESKKAEEALRRSEGLLKATNQIARTGGWELDLQTNELYWTDTIKEIHEVPLDYVPILEEGIQFYAPEHIPTIRACVEEAIKGQAYDVELQILTANNKRLWVRALGVPVFENGKVVRLRGVFQDIHERKLAEETLRQSEANLREAQHIAQLGNFEFNLHAQTVVWSDEVYRIFGVPLGEEVSLERYQNLLPAEDFQRVMAAVGETVASHEPYFIEHDIILESGERKHLYAIGRPLFDETTGEVNGIFGIVQNITERKQVEEALRRSEALLNTTNQIAQTGGWELDLRTDELHWTDTIKRIHGVAPDYVPNVSEAIQFYAPEYIPVIRAAVEEAMQGKDYDIELQIMTAQQERTWIRTIGQPIWENGEVVKLQGIFQDIHERKLVEEALRQSEERLRVIFENAPVGIVVTSLDGRLQQVNPAMCHTMGYTAAELLALSIADLTHPDDLATSQKLLKALIASEIPSFEVEKRYVQKGGSVITAILQCATIRDAKGNVVALIGQLLDISERKRDEAQIVSSLQEKEVLLKEIHHRVKNNLQVISSLLDLQASYVTDAEVQHMLQDSRGRVRSMALVHEQLYGTTDLAQIDFADYVERLTSFLYRSYGRQAGQVTLKLEIVPLLLSVETAVPLGLIINELVSNAYKHAFKGKQTGTIHIGLQVIDGDQLRLEIRDDGVGLPLGLDLNKSPSLGLTIVTTLVEQLLGTLSLRNEAGTGFVIDFVSDAVKAHSPNNSISP